MKIAHARWLAAILILSANIVATPGNAQTVEAPLPGAPDAGLYTTYTFGDGFRSVTMHACGNQIGGCTTNTAGWVGHIGAILQGYAAVGRNFVNRNIYVVDDAAGPNGDQVTLTVFQRHDDFPTPSVDSSQLDQFSVVPLPLIGGAGTVSVMAASREYVYIGNNHSGALIKIKKGSLELSVPANFSTGAVSSITSDDYGYVSATIEHAEPSTDLTFQFNPSGQIVGTGHPVNFFMTSETGLSTAGLPASVGNVTPDPSP
jgi:hypothetical protein